MRSHRRWIWRLEQEDQRLKKHEGRWIDIQRLRLLESFVDVYNNKFFCIRVNLPISQTIPSFF